MATSCLYFDKLENVKEIIADAAVMRVVFKLKPEHIEVFRFENWLCGFLLSILEAF